MDLKMTLAPGAVVPSRGSNWAAGLDLSAHIEEPIVLWRGERALVGTGVTLAIPHGYYGRIAPRSGLALRYGIDVMAGVIDSDYRGEVHAMVINLNDERSGGNFVIHNGDRIAQIIIEQIGMFDPVVVESLANTQRGDNGYGSTGVNESDRLSG